MKGVLEISTTPGIISAVAFVLFDIFLLTLFDRSLACSLSSFYYRRMFRHGDALRVRSADVPCVTNFLVGSRLSLMNNAVILFKFGILAVMLYVDLEIKSEVKLEKSSIVLNSTYGFDLSDVEWPNVAEPNNTEDNDQENKIRVIERRWAEVRECHVVGDAQKQLYNITFYKLGYNLRGGIVLEDERKPKGSDIIHVNQSTVTCLRPGVVEQPVESVIVRGCSVFRNGPCPAAIPKKISINLPFDMSNSHGLHSIPEGTSEATFEVFVFNSEVWKKDIPSYGESNATLTCSRTHFSAPSQTGRTFKVVTLCLFVVWANHTTLFEKWQYNPDTFSLERDFPGPVFEGIVDIGFPQRVNLLYNFYRETNWVTLASIVVAEGAVYRRLTSTNFYRLGASRTITIVSYTALIVTGVLLVAVVILRLATAFAFAGDERPQLNSIDGLSSIAREETIPSGRSVVRGHTSYVGLTLGSNGALRFGPLVDPGLAVRPIKGVDVI